jgi:fibronectin type 3 domain-containing protein
LTKDEVVRPDLLTVPRLDDEEQECLYVSPSGSRSIFNVNTNKPRLTKTETGPGSRHVEQLEIRRLLAIDTVQPLPFRLDFNSPVADSLLDKDGQGIGLTRTQANKNGDDYQPSLLDIDPAAGVLRITTTGTSAAGSNSNADNTLVNALETQFDGTTSGFTITARVIGPLSYLNETNEQAGIYFGPDQDNYIKLVAAFTSSGARLMFLMEHDANGVITQIGGASSDLVNIGSFAGINTLDLRLIGNASTGTVSAFYAVNGGNFVKLASDRSVPAARQAAFFNAASRAGVMAYHKHNNSPITATFDFFEITPGLSMSARPSISELRPGNGATGVWRDAYIAADVRLPNRGHGIDRTSVSSNTVRVYRSSDSEPVPGVINVSPGGDALVFTPSARFDPNTSYTFEVTAGVRDTSGAPFVPFLATFTTGTQSGAVDPALAFENLVQPVTQGYQYTSVTVGPDGKLYTTTADGKIIRYDIAADGSLSSPQVIHTITAREAGPRIISGLVFHPDSTAENLVAYVSHGEFAFAGANDFTGKITKLSGANLQTGVDLLRGLPRSVRDHFNNQLVFGPDGKLYFSVASNTASGAADTAWGDRPERLLSASILQIDLNALPSTLDVRTENVTTPYDPFAPSAAVKIYASGVRNAYDLLWHRNGQLYAPSIGATQGGAAPASPSPAYSTNRIDFPLFGAYTGPTVPGIAKINQTQNDLLYRVEPLGYYGHPNPTRYEWVLNGGNPTSATDVAEVTSYPVGVQPDRDYRGFAFDFGKTVSPRGLVEYRGGPLDGRILVTRFGGGDDILVLTPDASGNIVASQSGITGFSGFIDPVDITQHPTTGHLYVAEQGGQRITLLRAADAATGSISVDKTVFYFNDVTTAAGNSAASPSQRLTIRNTGTGPLTISALTLGGSHSGDFTLVSPPTTPTTLAPGQSLEVQLAMRATVVGLRTAILTIASNDPSKPTTSINLRGLGTAGTGGSNEPSLQRILDLYQIPINVGDNDPSTTDHYTSSSGPVTPNDEVLVQRLVRAGPGDVRIELLAIMANSVSPSVKFGWYEAGLPGNKTQLFTVPQADAQSVNPAPAGTLTFNPGTTPFGIYGAFPAFSGREVFSEDVLNQWESNSALRRKVRFYPLKNPDGSVVPNAYVFAFEEFTVSFDTNDIVGIIRNVNIAPASPHVSLENRDGLPFFDRLVFNRIRDLDPLYPNEVKDRATLRIRNTGNQPLVVSSLVLSDTTSFEFVNYTGNPITVNPNGFTDITIRFIYNRTGDGITLRNANLTVTTNDVESPTRTVQLSGLWQSHSEMNPSGKPIEPTLQQILDVLGYNLKVTNTGQNINTTGRIIKVGEEVLSPYWRRAEGGNVTVRMLAAYHQQAADRASTIRWHRQGSTTTNTLFKHRAEQGQMMLPTIFGSTTNPAQASFNPGSDTFGFKVDGTWSDPVLNTPNSANDPGHGIRWYIAKDRNGRVIPNTYILAHDYVGVSYSNYDYQDNVYLVTNVMPVSPPGALAGLNATGGSNGITLNWTRNTEGNVAGYRVYRASSSTGPFNVIASLVTNNSFLDTTAPLGQTSHYRVTAVDVHGQESAHGSANAVRSGDTSPPAAPSGLVASGTSGGITLDWFNNTESDLAGYNIYRSSSSNGTFTKLNATLLASSDYFDANAPSNATSFYRVTAVDTSGNESNFASVSAFRPAAGDIPTAPSGLNAVANTATQVTISWTDNSNNETGFRIERRLGSGSYAVLTTVATNITSFVDNTVSGGSTYTYRVRATGTGGDSAYSNEASVTTPQGVPAAPTNLTGVATSTQVTLGWTDNSGNETGFRVERRLASASTWDVLTTTAANATGFVDTTVVVAQTYVYRVFAFNSIGDSGASNQFTVNIPDPSAMVSTDIGNPVPAGSTTVVTPNRDFNVSVGGADIWNTADQFRFVYRLVSGNFDVKVRASITVSADSGSMVGIMARTGLTAGSPNVYVKGRASGMRMTYRTTENGTSTGIGGGTFNNGDWIRLQRVGNTFTGFVSADGFTWTQVSQVTLSLPTSLHLGLATSARTSSAAMTAQYREFSDTFGEPAPNAPSNLVANATGPSAVELTWADNSNNETGFRIERRVGSGSWATLTDLPANTTSFIDGSVVEATTYSYRVLAIGNGVVSPASNEVTVTTPGTVPLAPSNLNASLQTNAVGLTWTDNSNNETGFQVERQVAGGTWALLTTVNAGVTSFVDGTVAAGTTYEYRVRAINGVGPSGYSNVVSITTPSNSVGLTSADIGNPTPGSTVEITPNVDYDLLAGGADIWGTADQFRFAYRSVTGNFDVRVRVAEIIGSDTGATGGIMARESLHASARHAFMRVRNDSFRFNYRDVFAGRSYGITGATPSLPNAWVRLQRVGNVFTGFSSNDGVNWTQTHQFTLNLPSTLLLGLAGTARTSTGLATIRFREFGNTAGDRPTSSFTLQGTATATAASLLWSAPPADSTHFRIERAAGGVWSTLATIDAPAASYVDSTVVSGTTYTYRVTALANGTVLGESNTLSLTIPTA